ncbi:phenylalanine--tRNA ligase subunit alpha [Candidatus Peregrinibacteria bacterium]|nr:phenylalanine--tRNA ligase subunit alpha [Candidatus Peregrinibacteria bacterium]
MQEQIKTIKETIIKAIHSVTDEAALRELEVRYFGRKGAFNEILKGLATLSDDEKRVVGKMANETKKELEAAIVTQRSKLQSSQLGAIAETEWMDMTVPGTTPRVGHRHLVSRFIDDLESVFGRMGFDVATGPEVEEEHYNFNQLNVPEDHPARDMQDTFWIKNLHKYVLRTQTSPVQIRYMGTRKPPIRVIAPGKTFRKDSDATHSPMFHQVEGLMIDENISMANLKAVLAHALREIFETPSIELRFRASYFPFVEPGLEVDCTCVMCNGKGQTGTRIPCRLCKKSGWLEIAGAGMVHPTVLKNGGVDPERYTGFAFGVGIDRMIMLKYKIPHLRLLFENDLRFLEQF